MTDNDIKHIVAETINEIYPRGGIPARPRAPTRHKKMEFSKKLLAFASVLYAATWIVAVFSWFTAGEIPSELLQYSTWLYGASLAIYGAKAGVENKYKIENGSGEDVI